LNKLFQHFFKKSCGMAVNLNKSFKMEEFPGPFLPELHFTLGEWPIGQPPPATNNEIKNLYFRASGTTIPTISTLHPPEKWFVQWTAVQDKTNSFFIKGHCVSSETWTGCKWDIVFEARAHNWNRAMYGIQVRKRDKSESRW
ncbi:MAG: hypothetical protein WCS94_08195, partial [Verrucomicrobiota bacterium]